MSFKKINIVYVLLAVLVALYSVNIFITDRITSALVATPVSLSFLILEAPTNQCSNCSDGNDVIKMIDTSHNIAYKSRTLSYGGALSKKNIEMYDIKNLPAVIVSGDIKNQEVLSAWSALSGRRVSGNIVIENLLPYYDLKSNSVKGIVNVVLLKDKTCTSCFDENGYLGVLKRFGISINEVKTYDINSKEGKILVKKYAITKVPMFILSSSAGDYPALVSSWSQVGTVSQNGKYIFREVQKMGSKYKNI